MATPVKTAQGTWRIQIEVKGVRDSATRPSKREAAEWGATRSAELLASAQGRAAEVKSLAQALQRYGQEVSSTKRGWAKELIRLRAFLNQPGFPAKRMLADLSAADIVDWRDARLRVNARSSVLRDMVLLSHVLEVARRDWGWLRLNPMRDVRRPSEPDHRERVISGVEVRKMLRVLGWSRRVPVRSVGQAVANAFLLALQTGCRAGEICGLRWSDVGDGFFAVDGKTGKRDVPAVPATMRTLDLMRGHDAVFVFGLRAQSLDAMFRKYRARAALAGFTFHDARHTAATRLAQRLHVLDLCKMFGWTSTTRALVYYNPRAVEIAQRIASGLTGVVPIR
ncbi:site-specific integrase [Verminephrobacter aporrectodeae subsp. tuberculatae]|uniref:tyrosine-type recombinase/integrase n=1 Tax=Verminephrobacter aporrectodeae TaxID=1110389 RepID=UPI002244ED92|nr:tyrosine-type recombinase/integrase [Verminephrobacter aporrectodeae]MCW8208903.1 site-specific integrase [Verminephrobacter aporrectodeae subsp. tuberculatae]